MIRRVPLLSSIARRPATALSSPSSLLISSRSFDPSFRPLVQRPYASEAVETSQLVVPSSDGHKGSQDSEPEVEDFGGDGPLEQVKPKAPPIEACFYVSQIFPIKLGKLDPRPLLASIRKDQLLDQFPLIASHPSLKSLHSFTLLSTEKQPKDGGVFLRFSFVPPTSPASPDCDPSSSSSPTNDDPAELAEKALQEIEDSLKQVVRSTQGGFKTWGFLNLNGGAKLWRVRGRPWFEDLSRFASNRVKVTFDGPDVNQEALYDLLRPFGHISNLAPPTPQPALTSRSSMLAFSRLSSAAAAVSCLHGLSVSPKPPRTATLGGGGGGRRKEETAGSAALEGGPMTRLAFSYESPLKAHAFRDWISSHPRIALPALVALLGTLSYTFFDPIREFMVSSKLLDRFSLERSSTVKSLRSLGSTILPSFFPLPPPKPTASLHDPSSLHDVALEPEPSLVDGEKPVSESAVVVAGGADAKGPVGAGEGDTSNTGAWRERKEAEKMVEGWLRESPSGFILVTGPSGSGKLALVQQAIEKENKRSLVIDCSQIAKGKSEQAMVTELASQTGYWPFFGFLASANGLIDLASVGLIGQKAGFSSDFPTQLKAILDVVTSSLKNTSEHELSLKKGVVRNESERAKREAEAVVFRERLKRIGYHDPRIDSIAGNGLMSELGFGDEQLLPSDLSFPSDALYLSSSLPTPPALEGGSDPSGAAYLDQERDTIESLPVVVLQGFAQKGSKKDELWSTIAEWAGVGLIENRISQVIVIADNSSASKPLSKALPSRPLNVISLADADQKTSLNFVAAKLKLGDPTHASLTDEEKSLISVLGGRMNDLEQLVFKVRTGLSVSAAVEDIVVRSETELRKSLFGDDSSEAKSLPWTRSQAWSIVSALASKGEVAYQSLLVGFPFKGAEDQLKSLEAAELISVQTVNGRPSLIRSGKPLYREALKRLVSDPVFAATNLFGYSSELLAKQEAVVQACEQELVQLKDIAGGSLDARSSVGKLVSSPSAVEMRAEAVMGRMKVAQKTINDLEKQIDEAKLICKTHR